jgi:hypothetical protein
VIKGLQESTSKKCLFGLYRYCKVVVLAQNTIDIYGKIEFIRNYCAFCIKAIYAKRFKIVKYSVVNTL